MKIEVPNDRKITAIANEIYTTRSKSFSFKLSRLNMKINKLEEELKIIKDNLKLQSYFKNYKEVKT